ncbi:MAG: hypothetical protein QXT45_05840 [Candidatus Bilamarchaeaceae archaeon]
MTKKVISISTDLPDYDGLVTLRFTDTNGVVKEVPDIDGIALLEDLHKTLGPNEQEGLPFLNAIRRYIDVKFGVKINVLAARQFYASLESLAEEATSFFTMISGSGGTIQELTPENSLEPNATQDSGLSNDSEPKTPSTESSTNDPITQPE